MNHQQAVTPSLITQQPIPPSDVKRKTFFMSYKTIDFSELFIRNRNNSDYFIHYKGITFQDDVGRQLMTGNELMCYPTLAKKIREIDDYPLLKRCYAINKNIKGMPFIDYFYHRVKSCHHNFEKDLNKASLHVNQLIDTYGHDRFMPILSNQAYARGDALVIHDVEWPLQRHSTVHSVELLNSAHCIDLHEFFSISFGVYSVSIEELVPETPFIAVRIREKYEHKGHVKWYSLDTRQAVSKKEIAQWKKPL